MVAGLIDLGLVSAFGGLIVAGLMMLRAGNWLLFGDLAGHLISAIGVCVVASVVLAGFESGPLEATPGKLARGLRVRRYPGAERLGLGRAIVRNLFKLGLPVPLAYLAVLAACDDGGPAAWVGVAAAAVVAVSYLAGVLFGDGRPVYDQVAGSSVIRALPGRRFA